MKIDYSDLPDHLQRGAESYIEHGNPLGDFLTAVVCNDLKGAFLRADELNRPRIFHIVSFFFYEAPYACWGSREKMSAWRKHKGLEQMEDTGR